MSALLLAAADRNHVIGMGRIARGLCEGADMAAVWNFLHERIAADPRDANAVFDCSLILRLTGQLDEAQNYLRAALDQQACYTCRHGSGDQLSVLVFVAGADVVSNAPIDMVLEESNLTVHYMHVDSVAIAELPAHDVAFVAIGEASAHQPILQQLGPLLANWPVPVMNADVERISRMTRDEVSAALAGVDEILCPSNLRHGREDLLRIVAHAPGALSFPLTIRPVGTDCGKGLEKVQDVSELGDYLARYGDEVFFLAPFIDYSAADGEFRKYRIAFIDGRPFPAHLAISKSWIVHYLSAGMTESEAKRAEEERWMDTFDTDFAIRHAGALAAIQDRVGTDYFSIDCGEAPDGRLLFFEADVASILHALDPVETFTYKRPHMARLFNAFIAALEGRIPGRAAQLSAA